MLQFAVQAPTVYTYLRPLIGHVDLRSLHVAAVVAAFIPVFISRGILQISGFIDLQLASFLPKGNVLLTYAQTLYMLPVSLFGMSVSAAELPAMSSAVGTESEIAATLRTRLSAGLEKISFFVVPSAVAFLALGNVVASTLYRTGKFGEQDVLFRLGSPGRLRRRPAGADHGTPLFLHLLRPARHPHASALSPWCASRSPSASAIFLRCRCRAPSASTTTGASPD